MSLIFLIGIGLVSLSPFTTPLKPPLELEESISPLKTEANSHHEFALPLFKVFEPVLGLLTLKSPRVNEVLKPEATAYILASEQALAALIYSIATTGI